MSLMSTLPDVTSSLQSDLAELRERYDTLNVEIEEEEHKKAEIEADIKLLSKRMLEIDEKLRKKMMDRDSIAKLVQDTEAAYASILKSSQTLLEVLKRESAALPRRRSAM